MKSDYVERTRKGNRRVVNRRVRLKERLRVSCTVSDAVVWDGA